MNTVKVKEEVDKSNFDMVKNLFLIFLLILFTGPWSHTEAINSMTTDLLVQVKSGLYMIENHSFIHGDIFSWHENLNWVQHEIGWYFLSGLLYKLGGFYALLVLSCLSCASISILLYKLLKNKSVLLSVIIIIATSYTLFNQIYICRPQTISFPLIIYFIYGLWNNTDEKKNGIIFCVLSFVLSWFHGGYVPILFAIYAVYSVICFVCKDYKAFKLTIISLMIGFSLSLLTPEGIGVWTYGFLMKSAKITDSIEEWKSGTFSILLSLFVTVCVVAVIFTGYLKAFNKPTLIKIAHTCMFFVMYCMATRFIALFIVSLCFILIEVFDKCIDLVFTNISILQSVKDFTLKRIDIHGNIIAHVLLGVTALVFIFLILSGFLFVDQYNYNDLNSLAKDEGYDTIVVDEIKNRGYSKVLNTFNAGTWLIFNDIKVAQDNRCDPYTKQLSGEDYTCSDLEGSFGNMNIYVDKYKPDSILLDFTDYMETAYILDTMEQDKYELVWSFDAPVTKNVTSTRDATVRHWRLYEVKHVD